MTEAQNKEAVDVSAHPGAILKAAREESPYSMEQVADALHLRSTVVLAMEQENYQEFDSEVFLKGYYRSYCRLVGLHEERMVELLEKQLAVHRSSLAEEEAEVERARRAQKKKKLVRRSVFLLISLTLVAGVLFSLSGEDGSDEDDSPEAAVMGEIKNEDRAAQLPDDTMESALSVPAPLADSPEDTGLDRGDRPFSQPRVETALIEQPSGISELQAEAGLADNSLETDPVSSSDGQLEGAGSSAAAEVPFTSAGSGKMSIVFDGDCWLKIVDGDGKTPIARLQRAGDVVNYEGPVPLRVVLGDARVALVTYQGESFDMAPFVRSNGRAEFVLK